MVLKNIIFLIFAEFIVQCLQKRTEMVQVEEVGQYLYCTVLHVISIHHKQLITREELIETKQVV